MCAGVAAVAVHGALLGERGWGTAQVARVVGGSGGGGGGVT